MHSLSTLKVWKVWGVNSHDCVHRFPSRRSDVHVMFTVSCLLAVGATVGAVCLSVSMCVAPLLQGVTLPSPHPVHRTVNVSPVMQHNGNFQPPATPQQLPEGAPASTSSLSEENQSQQPSQPPGQPPAQGAAQEGGGFMLSPTAPSLYGSAYSPFEKPPPYAC